MDMLKILADALDSSIPAFHEFIQRYDTRKKSVYGFVEGKEDPSFYRGLIESNLPNSWNIEFIRAGNKDKVLKIFREMDWSRFPKKCVCFFIDRDLSEFLGETYSGENIYVTDKYSIENDVVTFKIMERILEEVFGVIDLTSSEIDLIKDLFESNLQTFSEAMAPVMAQIILWRRAAARIDLNNIEPKEYFVFNRGRIELKPDFASSGNRIQHAASRVASLKALDYEIAAAEVEFRERDGLKKYIRGKYIMWFFIKCGFEIPKAFPSLCPRYREAPKNRIGLGPRNAMIVISGWVRCPESLKIFLENTFIKYIREAAVAS